MQVATLQWISIFFFINWRVKEYYWVFRIFPELSLTKYVKHFQLSLCLLNTRRNICWKSCKLDTSNNYYFFVCYFLWVYYICLNLLFLYKYIFCITYCFVYFIFSHFIMRLAKESYTSETLKYLLYDDSLIHCIKTAGGVEVFHNYYNLKLGTLHNWTMVVVSTMLIS